jgi:hypothetical protein
MGNRQYFPTLKAGISRAWARRITVRGWSWRILPARFASIACSLTASTPKLTGSGSQPRLQAGPLLVGVSNRLSSCQVCGSWRVRAKSKKPGTCACDRCHKKRLQLAYKKATRRTGGLAMLRQSLRESAPVRNSRGIPSVHEGFKHIGAYPAQRSPLSQSCDADAKLD